MLKRFFLIALSLLVSCLLNVRAQSLSFDKKTEKRLDDFFFYYQSKDFTRQYKARMLKYDISEPQKIITIQANEAFAGQQFDDKKVDKIYKKLRKELPRDYRDYRLRITVNGITIDQLAAYGSSIATSPLQTWGRIEYKGRPWTESTDRPQKPTMGLQGRHMTVYASHGRYYDNDKARWKWQRPNLFCTTEDLFTQTIVVPFLMPMLENAGAIVYSPRERDWQTNEIIVDNDGTPAGSSYMEYAASGQWKTSDAKGFKFHFGDYSDNENPFVAGTLRQIKTTRKEAKASCISYKPCFPEEGRYAVYVSYATVDKGIDDAQYIVYHKGQETHVSVNQLIGGGTWVYIGTFDFDKGVSDLNRVVLTNYSSRKGVVTADAVRFGGGMGNIRRGGQTSGYPRALEGARYFAQWSGAPYSVYSTKAGSNDYGDDINTRPLMTNWLAGGSCYVPGVEGKGVPIDLSLAVHSDAGFDRYGNNLIGSLSICTTNFNDGRLGSGLSRQSSKLFASMLLDNTTKDLTAVYGKWSKRYLWDRNYSETRNPEVPSAIFETLSHQNFPDMKLAQDPNFKFVLARSIYKTILRFEASEHGKKCVVQPLRPLNFSVEFAKGAKGRVRLSWKGQPDAQEPTAVPTSYNVYTAVGNGGFDNGRNVSDSSLELDLDPGKVYNFKVTAVNDGGESFPTEVLSACYEPSATATVLIVNAFNRLSTPTIIDNDTLQGFDLDRDLGVQYGLYAGWNGRQTVFNKKRIGIEGAGGLGYGGDELAGHFIMGNTLDYVSCHAKAIASARKYNVASCSKSAVDDGGVNLSRYQCIDLILGLQKDGVVKNGFLCDERPSFTDRLTAFSSVKGGLLLSGSYIGSEMRANNGGDILRSSFNAMYQPCDTLTSSPTVKGLGLEFDIYRRPNKYHYCVQHPEVLLPTGQSFCAMRYADGLPAAVASDGGERRTFVMGFPFESITTDALRQQIMQGIMNFLIK